jgi:hypothetical protein
VITDNEDKDLLPSEMSSLDSVSQDEGEDSFHDEISLTANNTKKGRLEDKSRRNQAKELSKAAAKA